MTNLDCDSAMYNNTLIFMNYNRPFDTCQIQIRRDFNQNDDATQLARSQLELLTNTIVDSLLVVKKKKKLY